MPVIAQIEVIAVAIITILAVISPGPDFTYTGSSRWCSVRYRDRQRCFSTSGLYADRAWRCICQ